MPEWVRLLAEACDKTNQKSVAEKIGKSGGYVSRLLNRNYAGNYEEAEKLVRAAFGNEEVVCPIWGAMPLANCLRARRRTGLPRNIIHQQHAAVCPTCPNNTDRPREDFE